ncbi:MAG: hypothetical protein KC620_16435, partial [Myxococcales bacterium]|nr:hypothetical protein [Myxococcales bacterium]
MSALLREVAPRGGVPTFIALRAGGEGLDRICLAHRVPPASLPAIDRLRGLRHPHLARTLGVATIEEAPHALVALHAAEPLVRLR